MKFLQVLSQFEVTGAETFAAALSDLLIAQGHSVTIVSDSFRTPTRAEIIIHPVGKRDLRQRFANVRFLRSLIRDRGIDIVHAHSRAASWVSFFATRWSSVPLISSMHYRQHLHFSSKLFSVYGEKRVAVCRSIFTHLNRELKYPLAVLALVHNGIDLDRWQYRETPPSNGGRKVVSFVGRLTGFKRDSLMIIIREIFPAVYARYPGAEFHIVGAMDEQNPVRQLIADVNARLGAEVVTARGFTADVEAVYRRSDLIVGSGRVAMEALACGRPVVSIGESNAVGLIEERTADEALVTNFGDLDARRPIDVERSVTDILRVLNDPSSVSAAWGRSFVERNFDIRKVTEAMLRIFAEAAAQRRGVKELPMLSYHDIVPDGGGERRVEAAELDRHLAFLSRRGCTSMTFRDFSEVAAGRKPMPKRPVMLALEWNERSVTLALPLLRKHGLKAMFLVQTSLLGAREQDVRALHDAGMEIVAASVTGRKFNLLTPAEIAEEVHGSLRRLRALSGADVNVFAYPHGHVTEAVKETVRAAGCRYGISLDEGRRNIWDDPLKVRRIQLFHRTTRFSLWKKSSGFYYRYNDVY